MWRESCLKQLFRMLLETTDAEGDCKQIQLNEFGDKTLAVLLVPAEDAVGELRLGGQADDACGGH